MNKILTILTLSILLVACISDEKIFEADKPETGSDLSPEVIALSKKLGCDLTINTDSSFSSAFSKMERGQLLCLQDGVYNQLMNIPSNMHVRALNDGMAELNGQDQNAGWLAVLALHGSNSSVRGLKVHHASAYADACSIRGTNNRFRVMSCSHGGSHKHKIPLKVGGSGHLIEDSWFYGEGRYVVQCFKGKSITFRRNAVRWDSTAPNKKSEPNAAMSNYSCSNMIWENNISLDYGKPVTYMKHCGDMCMSTTVDSPNFNVQYLGNIVVNHNPETGNNKAFRADQKGPKASSNITIRDFYVRSVNIGIAVKPIYKKVTVENCTMIGVKKNSLVGGKKVACSSNADIQFRYVDGEKTTQPLWPWPNEQLIKNDMCASGERQSDWCRTSLSLSDYILTRKP